MSVENENYFSMFPKGEYKFDFFFDDPTDEFIYGAIVVTSFKSSVKIGETK